MHLKRKSKKIEDYLFSSFKSLNETYFSGNIKSIICWDIPSYPDGSQGIKAIKSTPLSISEKRVIHNTVERFIDTDDLKGAVNFLKPYADSGNDECQILMIRMLYNLGEEDLAKKASKRRNMPVMQISERIPASIEKVDNKWGIIRVDPKLMTETTIKQFVIDYIVHHEMLHESLDSDVNNPHSDEFRFLEKRIPNYQKSVEWLKNKQYTVC